MKPIVSGIDVQRYVTPVTETFLLFPYRVDDGSAQLIKRTDMVQKYPKAWAYLLTYEQDLRDREGGKMNQDEGWWAYNYPKNLDKQEIVKLIVPRLVSKLVCAVDEAGAVYLDNVDVGGVEAAESEDPFFLAGILNSPVADFVFRRISKPFRGNYLSANKQFIAPLPIPPANDAQRADVASQAKALQKSHTQRRRLIADLQKRLATTRSKSRPETWLFSNLKGKKDLIEDAPKQLEDEARKQWAEKEFEGALSARYEAITLRLEPGVSLAASFTGGEISFSIDGITVIDRIFVTEHEGVFILAQWKVLASTFGITEKTDGRKLCTALRKLAVPDNAALVKQIIDLEHELSATEAEIHRQERELNRVTYDLYQLSEQEITMIER
jgi:hypothetical protein